MPLLQSGLEMHRTEEMQFSKLAHRQRLTSSRRLPAFSEDYTVCIQYIMYPATTKACLFESFPSSSVDVKSDSYPVPRRSDGPNSFS